MTRGLAPQARIHLVEHDREVERPAAELREQLVRVSRWPSRQIERRKLARLRAREPVLAEALAQDAAQRRLERPGAQVVGDVVALVDVGEVGDRRPLHPDRLAQQPRVQLRHLRQRPPAGVQLQLVGELGRVAAQEDQLARPRVVEISVGGRLRRARASSQVGSSVRCSNRNANPSVTELSPRWRNSNGSAGSTFA